MQNQYYHYFDLPKISVSRANATNIKLPASYS